MVSKKVKAYLFWGTIMMFFASCIQVAIYTGVYVQFRNTISNIHIPFCGLSIFDWSWFTLMTHLWARDEE